MTASFRTPILTAAVAAILAVPAMAPLRAHQARPDVFAGFRLNVLDYWALKGRLAAALPPRTKASSFEEFVQINDRLRQALRHARRDVESGNMFVDESRPAFRDLIAFTLTEHGINVSDLLEDMKLDRPVNAPPVRMNEPFPWERGFIMVPCLLEALPSLPRDLQYKLDDRALVLVDVDVNLVLDVLQDALPKR